MRYTPISYALSVDLISSPFICRHCVYENNFDSEKHAMKDRTPTPLGIVAVSTIFPQQQAIPKTNFKECVSGLTADDANVKNFKCDGCEIRPMQSHTSVTVCCPPNTKFSTERQKSQWQVSGTTHLWTEARSDKGRLILSATNNALFGDTKQVIGAWNTVLARDSAVEDRSILPIIEGGST